MWGKVNSVMKRLAGEKLKILTFAQKTQILFWSEQKVF